LCHSIITVSPGFSEALRLLANVEANLGHLNDALTTYQKLVSADPNDVVARNNHGVMLQTMQRLDEA